MAAYDQYESPADPGSEWGEQLHDMAKAKQAHADCLSMLDAWIDELEVAS